MARALGSQAEEMGDIARWPKSAAALRAKPGTWFFISGGTPCTKLTGLVKKWDVRARVGPHMEPSNLLYLAHEGIQNLQKITKGK